jgi:hypothetical protein
MSRPVLQVHCPIRKRYTVIDVETGDIVRRSLYRDKRHNVAFEAIDDSAGYCRAITEGHRRKLRHVLASRGMSTSTVRTDAQGRDRD